MLNFIFLCDFAHTLFIYAKKRIFAIVIFIENMQIYE
jgi:hypothetical protein